MTSSCITVFAKNAGFPEFKSKKRTLIFVLNPLRDNVTRVLHEVFSKNLSSNLNIECFFLLI